MHKVQCNVTFRKLGKVLLDFNAGKCGSLQKSSKDFVVLTKPSFRFLFQQKIQKERRFIFIYKIFLNWKFEADLHFEENLISFKSLKG